MKRFLPLAAMCFCAGALAQQSQEDASVTAERARLKAERQKVEAQFAAEEKTCYRKFAVNDCLATARAKRRTAVDDLRRQEIALNDAERKRKAAERRQEIDQKEATQRQRGEGAQAKPPPDGSRELRSSERAAGRAAQAASSAQKAAERDREVQKRQADIAASKQRRETDAAKNAREHAQHVLDAKEREEKMRQRLADKAKAPASSLKDPG
ncbi:MAG TPA: hypothetical protein VIE63_01830 [Ramlibacter sp.]|jgi:hypothetical protein